MTNTAAQLVARCFAARTAAHLAHFSTKSYSRHIALNEFYDEIIDAADEFAEVYMGLEGLITAYPTVPVPSGAPQDFIRDLVKWLEANRAGAAAGHRALENLVDNITAVAARTLYKLENLR